VTPDGSLPRAQASAISSYSKPHQFNPFFPIPLLEDPFYFYRPIYIRVFQRFFPSGLPTKILYAPLMSTIPATCPAHLILLHLITIQYLVRNTDHKTLREVSGSIPGMVLKNFQVTYSFSPHSVAPRCTQPLKEMSTKEFPWGKVRPASHHFKVRIKDQHSILRS